MWRTIDTLLLISAFAERHEGAVKVFAKRPGYSLIRASPFFPGQISQPTCLRPRRLRTNRKTARPGKKRIPAHISSRGVVKVIGAWCSLPARRSTGFPGSWSCIRFREKIGLGFIWLPALPAPLLTPASRRPLRSEDRRLVRVRRLALLPGAPFNRLDLQRHAQIDVDPFVFVRLPAGKRHGRCRAVFADAKFKILIVGGRRGRVPTG
jgi:hypothetical protein